MKILPVRRRRRLPSRSAARCTLCSSSFRAALFMVALFAGSEIKTGLLSRT